MEQKSNSRVGEIKISFVVGVIVLAALVFGVFWMLGKYAPQNAGEPTVPGQQVQQTPASSTPQATLVPVKNLATAEPIRITEKEKRGGSYLVYKVADIIDGTYAGKIAVVAIPQSPLFPSEIDGASNTSIYFVADNRGMPIAWDENLKFYREDYCEGELSTAPCPDADYAQVIGLTPDLKQDLSSVFTTEKTLAGAQIWTGKTGNFRVVYTFFDRKGYREGNEKVVGMTQSGMEIVQGFEEHSYLYTTPFDTDKTYYTRSPLGMRFFLRAEPNFVDSKDVPQLRWLTGTTTVASYRYGQYAYGWQDCVENISKAQFATSLIKTGLTYTGDDVYEIDPAKYPTTYQCFHKKTDRYVYNPETRKGINTETVTYEEFIKTHPVFFWKHQVGDWMIFLRSDVVPAAEKAKPVIYLYPETPEKVSVKVAPIGGFTVTDPEYGNGWEVQAEPNGKITNLADGKVYPYLFWEGGEEGVVETPREGFVVKKENMRATLNEKLSLFGLNTQERNDFLEYWVPRLSRSPYYFITFISESEIDRTAPLTISPKPDTVLRILMDYAPLNAEVKVAPLKISPIERKGFTVIEWGGIIRD